MKKYLLLLPLLYGFFTSNAQEFPIDTIQYNGSSDTLINIVFVGDGYTASEQEKYIENVTDMVTYVFTTEPWKYYATYFNVFAIKVESPETGVSHPVNASDCDDTYPRVPEMYVNNYFGTQFDNYDIHRLIYPVDFGSLARVFSVNFPNYDLPIVLGNTGFYGGSGGEFICLPAHEDAPEILAHEMGHSFAFLADEYWAGDVYAGEKPNMTAESDPNRVKWTNWVGDNNIYVYPYGEDGYSAQWFRPHQNCKMRYLGTDFCSVCVQTIIERIHDLVNPLQAYEPMEEDIDFTGEKLDFKFTKILKPNPNTLKIEWVLNDSLIAENVDSITLEAADLEAGFHILFGSLEDTTSLLRVDKHEQFHRTSIMWMINKTTTATEITSMHHRLHLSFYPNPASDFLILNLESDNYLTGSFYIASANGDIVRKAGAMSGKTIDTVIDISSLPAGIYFLNFQGEDFINLSRKFLIE